jgi:hypothetical protein
MDQIHPGITAAEDAILTRYAIEQGGRVTTLTLTADETLYVQWTDAEWDDGTPVTKMFARNGERRLKLKKGTVLKGVAYEYNVAAIDQKVTDFDFCRDGVWYSMKDAVDAGMQLA